jgi:hypothetical protein
LFWKDINNDFGRVANLEILSALRAVQMRIWVPDYKKLKTHRKEDRNMFRLFNFSNKP